MSMDYARLTKKLTLPVGSAAPRRLGYDDLVATAISRHDLADDVRGINMSLDLIQQTRGGALPTGPGRSLDSDRISVLEAVLLKHRDSSDRPIARHPARSSASISATWAAVSGPWARAPACSSA
jgi:hypothetical protein